MSYLKINPDLFLGSQELNRWQKFLDDDGFRKLLLQNTLSFGIINVSKDGNWDNFKIQQGTNIGTIKNNAGLAIDINGQLITRDAIDNINLTNDNQWYWIKIKHQYSSNEIGTVSIDLSGNLIGVGTEFTKVLRGVPNNPVKIRFSNAVLNTQEYFVQEVIDDTTAILSGNFLAETTLNLVVVGAFTPDISVPSDSKEPFQYSSCLMTLVLETVSNTPPSLTQDEEFVIARVKRNGATITIQDKRSLSIYRSKPDFDLFTIDVSANPLIGIESIKFDNINTPRNENLVYLAWGFRSSNWTIDSSINRVTLIGGNGGKFKTTANFTDGDFDGWSIYTANGKRSIIKQSSISALQINLILDSLDPDDYIDTTQQLVVVPSVETIEIIATPPNTESQLTAKRFTFLVNQGYAILSLPVYKDTACTYIITYRYGNYKLYSEATLIPDDDVIGYLVEADFDTDGTQTASGKQIYTNGIITLQQASNAYSLRIAGVETGDVFGVEYLALDNANPVYNFVVGVRKDYVIITNDDFPESFDESFGLEYDLTTNHFLNFRTDTPATLKNGNRFRLQFRGDYVPGAYGINITQDYVNPSNPGTIIHSLTLDDFAAAAVDGLIIDVIYDGERWFVQRIADRRDLIHPQWIDVDGYINSWISNGGGAVVQYWIDRSGLVHLRGVLNGSSATNDNALGAGSLPIPSDGYAPTFPCVDQSTFTNANTRDVTVNADGSITVHNRGGGNYDLSTIKYFTSI